MYIEQNQIHFSAPCGRIFFNDEKEDRPFKLKLDFKAVGILSNFTISSERRGHTSIQHGSFMFQDEVIIYWDRSLFTVIRGTNGHFIDDLMLSFTLTDVAGESFWGYDCEDEDDDPDDLEVEIYFHYDEVQPFGIFLV